MKNQERGEILMGAVAIIAMGTFFIGWAFGNKAAIPKQPIEVCERAVPYGNEICHVEIRPIR